MIEPTPFKNESDYQLMRNLIIKNQRDPLTSPYPSLGDLDFRRFLENDAEGIGNVHLWKDECDKLMGFIWPDKTDPLMVCDTESIAYEEYMLVWAEEKICGSLNKNEQVYHYMDCYNKNQKRIALLNRLEYQKTEYFCWYGILNLNRFTPIIYLRKGYIIRALEKRDITQRMILHEIAAGKSIDEKRYHSLIENAPTYKKDLDLICVSPDGKVAAFSTLWFDSKNMTGLIEPYGTHPDHRRKKLMSSLLSHGLEKLKQLGVTTVFVSHGGCDSEELDSALKLNLKMGFKELGRDYFWKKPVARITIAQ